MMLPKRLALACGILLAAAVVFSVLRLQRPGYGLLDLLQGRRPGQHSVTLASQPALTASDVPGLSQMDEEYAKLSAAVLPSVVSIHTQQVRQVVTANFFGMPGFKRSIVPGEGSGAIISREGHVVTNYHVIANQHRIVVRTEDGTEYEADVLSATENPDIAVLKIRSEKKDFPALTFGDSDKVRVGQVVFAVGNPFGLSGTVTQGIICARNRRLREDESDLLQTDAVINPGNSGGPLINVRGEMVGINVAIYRGDQNVQSWQGVGLAIPAKEAKWAVDALLERSDAKAVDSAQQGFLGVEVAANPIMITTGESRGVQGVLVTGTVPESPAERAGFQSGDVIVNFDSKPVPSDVELFALLRATRAGKTVRLHVWRDGELGVIDVRLGSRKG
jgi:S1-C subfamily serine protease